LFLYHAVLDRRSTSLFNSLSATVSDQIYDGRWFDPATRAAMLAITELTKPATGIVTVNGAFVPIDFFVFLRHGPVFCCCELIF
jgi:argininosuccinate synthase